MQLHGHGHEPVRTRIRIGPSRSPARSWATSSSPWPSEWESRGKLALVGMGMDPGLTDVFAAHAAKHDFDEVARGPRPRRRRPRDPRLRLRAGVQHLDHDRGVPQPADRVGRWRLAHHRAVQRPGVFPFPEGIGPVECVNVEHEEVLLVPRWIKTRPRDVQVRARRRLHRQAQDDPRPRHGPHRSRQRQGRRGRAARRAGRDHPRPDQPRRQVPSAAPWSAPGCSARRTVSPRETYAYQMCRRGGDLARDGLQVVGWQTGFNPTVAMELLATGAWSGAGVLGPEAFDPDPYLAMMNRAASTTRSRRWSPGRIGQPDRIGLSLTSTPENDQ